MDELAIKFQQADVSMKETARQSEDLFPQFVPRKQKPKSFLKKIAAMVGFICSIAIIILGIVCASGSFSITKRSPNEINSATTVTTSHSYYGGDAYSGMQQASADASNNAAAAAKNVAETNKILPAMIDSINANTETNSVLAGLIIIALGAISASWFGYKFFEIMSEC